MMEQTVEVMPGFNDSPGRIRGLVTKSETLIEDFTQAIIEVQKLMKYYNTEMIEAGNEMTKTTDQMRIAYLAGKRESYKDHLHEMGEVIHILKNVVRD